MVDVARACGETLDRFVYKAGAFYGHAAGRALGAGLIYSNISYPLFAEDTGLFDTVEGLALVLTHECDVDSANPRDFNEYLLICPIIPFDGFADQYAADHSEGKLWGTIPDIANDCIYRLFYIPPISRLVAGNALLFGGIMFLNHITSTHISAFTKVGVGALCAFSDYAMDIFDKKLTNHLLRPKTEALPRLV